MGFTIDWGADWSEDQRAMYHGQIFSVLKRSEKNDPPGLSLHDIHECFNGQFPDMFGTVSQFYHELQLMMADELIYEDTAIGKDVYRIRPGAKNPGGPINED